MKVAFTLLTVLLMTAPLWVWVVSLQDDIDLYLEDHPGICWLVLGLSLAAPWLGFGLLLLQ